MKRLKTFFMLPLCLLALNALQELATYKLERAIPDTRIFVAVMLLMTASGFAIVGNIVSPWIESFIDKGHKGADKTAGGFGIFAFYAGALVFFYVVYYFIYSRGPQSLLPPQWR